MALLGAVVGGCASGATSCGALYVLTTAGGSFSTNSCAGNIPARPVHLYVRVGDRFQVSVAHNTDGNLAAPMLTVRGQAVRFLGRSADHGEYEAEMRGTADLVARRTALCAKDDGHQGSCLAFVIRVR